MHGEAHVLVCRQDPTFTGRVRRRPVNFPIPVGLKPAASDLRTDSDKGPHEGPRNNRALELFNSVSASRTELEVP